MKTHEKRTTPSSTVKGPSPSTSSESTPSPSQTQTPVRPLPPPPWPPMLTSSQQASERPLSKTPPLGEKSSFQPSPFVLPFVVPLKPPSLFNQPFFSPTLPQCQANPLRGCPQGGLQLTCPQEGSFQAPYFCEPRGSGTTSPPLFISCYAMSCQVMTVSSGPLKLTSHGRLRGLSRTHLMMTWTPRRTALGRRRRTRRARLRFVLFTQPLNLAQLS